jgi:ABC-2 type transport system permease protein
MTGFAAFARKELLEIVRTWRIWVLPGVLVFAAVSAPVLTALLPTLAERFGSATPGIQIEVGEQTALDAYVEYLGNLGELVALAIVIAYGGLVSAELRGGPGPLVLTKPLSRPAYVVAKWTAQALLVTGATALATGLCIALTSALFDPGPAAALIAAVALWLVWALLLLSAMLALSSLLGAPVAASAAGVGLYVALAVLGQFSFARWTPAALPSLALDLLEGHEAAFAWPLATAATASALLVAVAVARFGRREIAG